MPIWRPLPTQPPWQPQPYQKPLPQSIPSALNSKVGSLAIPAATGNQSVAGLGFSPEAILFYAVRLTADGTNNGGGGNNNDGVHIGAVASATKRWALTSADNNLGSSTFAQRTDACIIMGNAGSNGVLIAQADIVSLDADGFTINWSSVTANIIVNYIALGGGDLTNTTTTNFAAPTSTGKQTISGIGFRPDCVLLFTIDDATTPPDTSTGGYRMGMGMGIAPNRRAWWGERGATADTRAIDDTHVIGMPSGTTTDSPKLLADLVSMNPDGFTLNWSTVEASAVQVFALCLKGGNYTIGAFNQPASTGNQTILGLPTTPKGIIYGGTGQTGSGSLREDHTISEFSLGATDVTNRGSIAHSQSNDGVIRLSRTADISFLDANNGTFLRSEADIFSAGTAAFIENWTTIADTNARQVMYMAAGNAGWARRTGATLGVDVTGLNNSGTWNAGSLGSTVYVGDRIICVIEINTSSGVPPTIASVTDSLGNVYFQDQVTAGVGFIPENTSVWSAPVTTTGIPAISVNYSGSGGISLAIAAGAYSGLSTANAGYVDVQTSLFNNTSANPATSGTTTGVTTAANELRIGAYGDAGFNDTLSAGGGYSVFIKKDTSSSAQALLEDSLADVSGASAVATVNNGGNQYAEMGVLVYKLAGGDPGTVVATSAIASMVVVGTTSSGSSGTASLSATASLTTSVAVKAAATTSATASMTAVGKVSASATTSATVSLATTQAVATGATTSATSSASGSFGASSSLSATASMSTAVAVKAAATTSATASLSTTQTVAVAATTSATGSLATTQAISASATASDSASIATAQAVKTAATTSATSSLAAATSSGATTSATASMSMTVAVSAAVTASDTASITTAQIVKASATTSAIASLTAVGAVSTSASLSATTSLSNSIAVSASSSTSDTANLSTASTVSASVTTSDNASLSTTQAVATSVSASDTTSLTATDQVSASASLSATASLTTSVAVATAATTSSSVSMIAATGLLATTSANASLTTSVKVSVAATASDTVSLTNVVAVSTSSTASDTASLQAAAAVAVGATTAAAASLTASFGAIANLSATTNLIVVGKVSAAATASDTASLSPITSQTKTASLAATTSLTAVGITGVIVSTSATASLQAVGSVGTDVALSSDAEMIASENLFGSAILSASVSMTMTTEGRVIGSAALHSETSMPIASTMFTLWSDILEASATPIDNIGRANASSFGSFDAKPFTPVR